MDAIVLLRDDHKTVEKLFKRFETEWFPGIRKATGRSRPTVISEQLKAEKGKAPRDPLAVPSAASK
ncbi:hypothetical protein ACIRSJ_27480 [Streptomyces virginiae]|uniref:hypothetical protein n=1 Tax=Streptomyces virginiae TaxID=1961 RepID=UPI003820CA35